MSEQPSRPPSVYLEPPNKSVELEDPGAQDTITSNSGDEHFSDASEGHRRSVSLPPSGRASPIPRTRVEKVDDNPRYGEVPGTLAYEKREQDAVPDEIEIVPEGSRSRSLSTVNMPDRPRTPGGTPIPLTLVEKVDLISPSYGDVPGTAAYEQRKADAVPDMVMKVSDPRSRSPSPSPSLGRAPSEAGSVNNTPLPETRVLRVDSIPSEETEPGPRAHTRRPSDSLPDLVERVQDAPDSPTSLSTSSEHPGHVRRKVSLMSDHDDHEIDDNDHDEDHDGSHVGRGKMTESEPLDGEPAMDDEFDDFAQEQEDAGDDDFGDFDDAFQEPDAEVAGDVTVGQARMTAQQPLATPSVPPLVDFDTFQSLPELMSALDDPLDHLFPASKDISSLPPLEPIQDASAIFSTERSLSLWSQLVAPPPLQPQNWVKSRIRRLFLVSLGVPVDLDEILPASKQKKLVLPSINLDVPESGMHLRTDSRTKRGGDSSSQQNAFDQNPAATFTHGQTGSRQRTSRRGEPSPPPELDLLAVRRLCATTDAALEGLTDEELKAHVTELKNVTLRASSVLEYWLKRRDGLISEKEAFEGVIENLVNHARRVRK